MKEKNYKVLMWQHKMQTESETNRNTNFQDCAGVILCAAERATQVALQVKVHCTTSVLIYSCYAYIMVAFIHLMHILILDPWGFFFLPKEEFVYANMSRDP